MFFMEKYKLGTNILGNKNVVRDLGFDDFSEAFQC